MNFVSPKNPKVSVIVASFNTGRFVKDTIGSILAQAPKIFEVIVVDGASTDKTLSILKSYKGIQIISEPDSGYLEAFRKGLKLARGEYIMQCAVSDGLLEKKWIEKCAKILDSNKDISLVWGFPQYMSEDGILGDVSYPQFYHRDPPQKENFFYYWLSTGFNLPEGNFVVRKNVMEECFPLFDANNSKFIEPWLEFNYRFNTAGYMPYFLRIVANFGRIHKNQLSSREKEEGVSFKKFQVYITQVQLYRKKIFLNPKIHHFRDGNGNILAINFSRTVFFSREILLPRKILKNLIFLIKPILAHFLYFENVMPKSWMANLKKYYREL